MQLTIEGSDNRSPILKFLNNWLLDKKETQTAKNLVQLAIMLETKIVEFYQKYQINYHYETNAIAIKKFGDVGIILTDEISGEYICIKTQQFIKEAI
jgi:hypothetical protein